MSLFERIYPVHFAKEDIHPTYGKGIHTQYLNLKRQIYFHFAKRYIRNPNPLRKKGVQAFAFQEIQEEKLPPYFGWERKILMIWTKRKLKADF